MHLPTRYALVASAALPVAGCAPAERDARGPPPPSPYAMPVVDMRDGALLGAVTVDFTRKEMLVTVEAYGDLGVSDLWLTVAGHDTGLRADTARYARQRHVVRIPCDEDDCSRHCGELVAVRALAVFGDRRRDGTLRPVDTSFAFRPSCTTSAPR